MTYSVVGIDRSIAVGCGLIRTFLPMGDLGATGPALADGQGGDGVLMKDALFFREFHTHSLSARVIVDVAALGEAEGLVSATIHSLDTQGAWTMTAGKPGESLALWAPKGEAWLEVHWHHSDDGQLVYLRKIRVDDSDKPQRISVTLPAMQR